jgi:tRNA(His) 5'-end guanylyltransferase
MSNKKDSLGDRMKSFYEAIPKTFLMRRTPVIIRIDGKAFHTFSRNFNKPFDMVLSKAMSETMKALCENIQGCVLGYTQSDEITLVLQDYKELKTQAWFDYNVQKMCSIAASMATMYFNKYFECFALDAENGQFESGYDEDFEVHDTDIYKKAIEKGAMFDARCFNMPIDEVTNCLIWRQQDASRNSIEMVGRYYFGHKKLYKKNGSDIQDMLMNEFKINWNNYPTRLKRGTCAIRIEKDGRSEWVVDEDIPIFTQDRDYIESRIKFE